MGLVRGAKATGVHFGYFVFAAMVISCFIPLSLALSCAGIFYPALSDSLGVDEGTLSYYTSVLYLAAMVALPSMGKLLNDHDARVCTSAAVAVIACAFVWLSQVRSLWMFYVAAAAMGVGVGMLLFLAPSTLINRWFAKGAGLHLGIAMAFTGVGGMVWSAVGGSLLISIGWSSTYLAFAALTAATLPVMALLTPSRPSDKGLSPIGSGSTGPAEESSEGSGVPAFKAFRSVRFGLICLMCFCLNMGMYAYFMIPSYATTLDIGASLPLLGATASSVAMAGQTVSKVALGAVGERLPRISTIVGLVCGVAGLACFATFVEQAFAFYLAAALFGVFYGLTNVMTPILTRNSFGDRDYAKIYSRVSMAASIGSVAAAFVWGTLLKLTQSYALMFGGIAAFMIVAIVAVLALGIPKAK